jgi:hypothetical protein
MNNGLVERALHEKSDLAAGVEKIFPAKAQRRKENLQKRSSALLCALAGESPKQQVLFVQS